MWIPPTHQGHDFQSCLLRGEGEKHHSMEEVGGNWRTMVGTLDIDELLRRSLRSNRSPTKISAPACFNFSERASCRRTKARTGNPFRRSSNTAAEAFRPAADVTRILGFVMDFFRDTAKVLQRCITRAVEKGEFETSIDIAELATYLATEFRTALMLAASGHSRRDIQRHLEVALRVLQ